MTIHKCPCGHRACNQYTMDTQSSVGFHKDVATLYNAAPDMLAALKNLVNSFEKHRPKEYWDAARAAIAKAEGETA